MPLPSSVLLGPSRIYLGIDPGASGGMAYISGSEVKVQSMLPTPRDVWDWFCGLGATRKDLASGRESFAVLELNTGYVGGAGNPGSTMFKFGKNTGWLEGFLIACGIPYEEVSPSVWQKALGITPRKNGKGAESKGQFKSRLKSAAQKLFPQVGVVTLQTCDALLIAEFCRRKREGLL